MKLNPIITSPLIDDVYKRNMGNIIFKLYNDYITTWCFKCRNEDVRFIPEMITEIREQIDWYCKNVRYTKDDIEYLKFACPWLSNGYLNFLKHWTPDRSDILINEGNIQSYNNCGLAIEAHGTWLDTSSYEIPILAIVNEVYFAFKYGVGAKNIDFQEKTIEKFNKIFDIDTYENILAEGDPPNRYSKSAAECYTESHPYDIGTFAEFGLRRRYSGEMQDWLINYITSKKIPGFVGTSNIYLAKKYGVKPMGTQAHEFFMAYQGNPRISKEYSNYYAMKDWVGEYHTLNGIALTDTIGTDIFLKDFDLTFANLFSGVRHDSGDPIEWGENMIAHYEKLGINPMNKTLLFSDSLDFEKATAIKKHFEDKTKVSFGIGTYLSGIQSGDALNIVFKMTECNGYPVAKLSNCSGKVMCKDQSYIEHLQRCLDWRRKFS